MGAAFNKKHSIRWNAPVLKSCCLQHVPLQALQRCRTDLVEQVALLYGSIYVHRSPCLQRLELRHGLRVLRRRGRGPRRCDEGRPCKPTLENYNRVMLSGSGFRLWSGFGPGLGFRKFFRFLSDLTQTRGLDRLRDVDHDV